MPIKVLLGILLLILLFRLILLLLLLVLLLLVLLLLVLLLLVLLLLVLFLLIIIGLSRLGGLGIKNILSLIPLFVNHLLVCGKLVHLFADNIGVELIPGGLNLLLLSPADGEAVFGLAGVAAFAGCPRLVLFVAPAYVESVRLFTDIVLRHLNYLNLLFEYLIVNIYINLRGLASLF